MKTILVVEDVPYARHFICSTLQKKGYHTLGAASAQQAYNFLSQDAGEINLVLSDLDTPDNGFDLLRTIKSNPTTVDIPVVFLTTDYHTDRVSIARDSGIASFVQRPFREQNFFAEIDRAISIKGSIVNLNS